jgi:FimV-like protein
MRKVALLTVLTLAAQCVFADAPFSTGPAPVQSFHTVQNPQPVAIAKDNATSAASPSSVAAVAQPAASQSLTVPAAAPLATSAALDSGAAIIHANLPQAMLAQNTNNADQRIQNLMQSNQAMGSAIRAINQNIAVMQEQMTQLAGAHSSSSSSDWFSHLTQNPDFIGFLSFGGVSVLLLMFGVMIGRMMMKKAQDVAVMSQKKVQADVLDDDTKTEYDFMSSSEAIPAKLDLARAYIAMNDEEQARLVLKTIIENGNSEQRSEALILIQSMINKK